VKSKKQHSIWKEIIFTFPLHSPRVFPQNFTNTAGRMSVYLDKYHNGTKFSESG